MSGPVPRTRSMRLARHYSPLSFVVATNFCPFALSSNVTVAPETKAPVGSLTTPRREVVAFWAKLLALQIDNRQIRVVLQISFVTGRPPRKSKVELHSIAKDCKFYMCFVLYVSGFLCHFNGV